MFWPCQVQITNISPILPLLALTKLVDRAGKKKKKFVCLREWVTEETVNTQGEYLTLLHPGMAWAAPQTSTNSMACVLQHKRTSDP